MRSVLDSRALVIHSTRETIAIVSDLHIGYSSEIQGLSDTLIQDEKNEMMVSLSGLLEKHSVDSLYIVGDLKHTILIDRLYNWSVIPEFVEAIAKHSKVHIIPGNHDGGLRALLPRDVEVSDPRGQVIVMDGTRVGLVHGHAWPSGDVLRCDMVVMGHHHPCVRRMRTLTAKDVGQPARRVGIGTTPVVLVCRVRGHCISEATGININRTTLKIVVLPCYNPLIHGRPVDDSGVNLEGPILDLRCIDSSRIDAYTTEGLYIGTVEQLRNSQRND
ncbi:MAG: metallophosphoesterase [Candidatus Thorarchaeota archaeon]